MRYALYTHKYGYCGSKYSCHNNYYCERKRVEILNGNYGEDDKVEVNQMGESMNKYASMSATALLNLINFTAGSKLMSSQTPLQLIIETQTKERT